MTEEKKSSKSAAIIKELIAGGVGGSWLVFVGHPLDTIKVKIQTMIVKPGSPPPYTGAIDCARKTLAKEGIPGLYKGMLAPLSAVTPMYSFCFFGYGIGKSIFCTEETFQNLTAKNLFLIALAGATSGIFTSPILAPSERLKCVLQVQNESQSASNKKFSGPSELGKHILKTEGIASLFRGYLATNLRDCIASMAYFSTYEWLKSILLPRDPNRSHLESVLKVLFCGGMAGIMNWVPAIPIDTLKSRYQTAPNGKYPHGIRSVAMEIYREDGIRAIRVMYRGFGAVMMRAFPANAACFLGYETTKKILNPYF